MQNRSGFGIFIPQHNKCIRDLVPNNTGRQVRPVGEHLSSNLLFNLLMNNIFTINMNNVLRIT
jgi:hypothetical protein